MRLPPLVILTCGLLIGAVPELHAQPAAELTEDQKADAANKYREGLGLFEGGQTADALPLFREALELTGSPNARLMVARCLRQLDQLIEAYEHLQQVVRDTSQDDDPKYAKTRESAANELVAVEALVGKLTISVKSPPADLTVELDGKKLEAEALAQPVVVQPGEHEIVASASGRETLTRKVEVGAGATANVELELVAPPAEEKPSPQPEPEPPIVPEPERTDGTIRLIGYVVAGVGVAGLGVFATTGLMAKSKYDSVYDACGGERCTDSKYDDDIDSGKSLQTIANVSLVVGSVAVLAGSAMILFGGPTEQEAPEVSAALVPGGGYLGYSGRF